MFFIFIIFVFVFRIGRFKVKVNFIYIKIRKYGEYVNKSDDYRIYRFVKVIVNLF